MYRLPQDAIYIDGGDTVHALLARLIDKVASENFNVLWLPTDILTACALGNRTGYDLFSRNLYAKGVTLIPVRNLTCGIIAYIPPGTQAPQHPIGYPTAYNAMNKRDSCLFIRLDERLFLPSRLNSPFVPNVVL